VAAPARQDKRIVALVTARDEADRIGASVAALRAVSAIGQVVVVDDGSRDGTANRALDAGATVILGGPAGKGGALEAALVRVEPADAYVLAAGDLGSSAGGLEPLLSAVLSGRADLAVGILPRPPTGGLGLVKSVAARLVEVVAGARPEEPLSGQRAITRECLWSCRPLAAGFGVETAMTADAMRMGFSVAEVPVEVEHRFTRKDLAGFRHRGRQGLHILRAAVPRLARVR